MLTAPEIQTARLVLRPFDLKDIDPLHQIMNEEHIMRYFPNSSPPDPDRIERIIVSQIDHWKQYHYGWWILELGDDPGKMIGWAGLQYLPETDENEVAYLLSRTARGCGLATEAGHASLQFGFEQHGMETIVGIVHHQNITSQRVLERLGMGERQRATYFNMDCYRYEIKQDQYINAQLHRGRNPGKTLFKNE